MPGASSWASCSCSLLGLLITRVFPGPQEALHTGVPVTQLPGSGPEEKPPKTERGRCLPTKQTLLPPQTVTDPGTHQCVLCVAGLLLGPSRHLGHPLAATLGCVSLPCTCKIEYVCQQGQLAQAEEDTLYNVFFFLLPWNGVFYLKLWKHKVSGEQVKWPKLTFPLRAHAGPRSCAHWFCLLPATPQ